MHDYLIRDENISFQEKIPEKFLEDEKKRFEALVGDIISEYREEFFENLDRLEGRVDVRSSELPEKKRDYFYYTQ